MASVTSRAGQTTDVVTEPPQPACAQCAMEKLCFPAALPTFYQTLFPLANAVRTRLKRGEVLFQAGEQQIGVYAVKAGYLMTTMTLPDGQSKIVGFHAAGDVLGLDSLGGDAHRTAAVALNVCELCVVDLDRLEKLLEHPVESTYVRQLLAREIARVETQAATVATLSAKQRVATFLIEMSDRWEDRGYSKTEFVLFMSRKEIGNFLGLTFETVSRTLSYFQSKKWITVHGKNMLIRDLSALRKQIALAT